MSRMSRAKAQTAVDEDLQGRVEAGDLDQETVDALTDSPRKRRALRQREKLIAEHGEEAAPRSGTSTYEDAPAGEGSATDRARAAVGPMARDIVADQYPQETEIVYSSKPVDLEVGPAPEPVPAVDPEVTEALDDMSEDPVSEVDPDLRSAFVDAAGAGDDFTKDWRTEGSAEKLAESQAARTTQESQPASEWLASGRAASESRRDAEGYRNQAARENPTVAIEGGHAFKDLRDPALVDMPGELTDGPEAAPEAPAEAAAPPEGFSMWKDLGGGRFHYQVEGDVGYSYIYDSTNDTFTIDEGSATGGGAVIGPGSPAHTAIKAQMMNPTTYRADIPSKTAASKALAGEAESFERPPLEAGSPESEAALDESLARHTEAPPGAPVYPDEPVGEPDSRSVLDLLDEGFKRQRLEGVSAAPHVEETLGAPDPALIGRLVNPDGFVNLPEVARALENDELTLEDWQLIEGALKKQRVIRPTSPQTTQRRLYEAGDRPAYGGI